MLYKCKDFEKYKPTTNRAADIVIEMMNNNLITAVDITRLNYAFTRAGCKSITLPAWNTKKVTRMDYMFAYLPITSADISKLDFSSVETARNMFYLTNIVNIDFSHVVMPEIGNLTEIAGDLRTLRTADMSGITGEKLYSINYIFNNCPNLLSVNFDNLVGGSNMEAIQSFSNCTSLKSLSFPKLIDALNLRKTFYHCSSLTSFSAPLFVGNSVQEMSFCFDGCTNLASVSLPNFEGKNVKTANSAFSNGVKLNELCLPKFTGENIEEMDSFASGEIQSLDLPALKATPKKASNAFTNKYNGSLSGAMRKVWLPKTFKMHENAAEENKPFNASGTDGSIHIYTDAVSAEAQNWGTISGLFTMHYNATHEDFENA